MQFFDEGKSLVCTVDDFVFAVNLADEKQVTDVIEFVQAVNEQLCPQSADIQSLIFSPYRNERGEYSVQAMNGEKGLLYSVGDEKTAVNICIFLNTVFSVVKKYNLKLR